MRYFTTITKTKNIATMCRTWLFDCHFALSDSYLIFHVALFGLVITWPHTPILLQDNRPNVNASPFCCFSVFFWWRHWLNRPYSHVAASSSVVIAAKWNNPAMACWIEGKAFWIAYRWHHLSRWCEQLVHSYQPQRLLDTCFHPQLHDQSCLCNR